jgi:hypothetical protein
VLHFTEKMEGASMLLLIVLLILLFGGGGFLWLPQQLLRTVGNGLGERAGHFPRHLSPHGQRVVRIRNVFSVILEEL